MANNGSGSIQDIRKKFHETHELISTSYHESGHTIYGLLHFMKIDPVYVFENKKTKRIEGFTHYESKDIETVSDPELLLERVVSEICFSYAGLAAEKYYFKLVSGSDKLPMFLRDGSSDDTLYSASLINKYEVSPPGKKRYDYKKKLIRGVTKELTNNWDAVTLVSHNLFQKKRLNFYDLKDLLTKKTKNKEFWKEQFKKIEYIYNSAENVSDHKLKLIFSI